jgi:Subtilase family
MDELQHLFPRDTGQVYPYQYTGNVVTAEFAFPGRDVVPHSQALLEQIAKAREESKTQSLGASSKPPKGMVLEFASDPNFELMLKRLESESKGIELRNSRVDSDHSMMASVFVPEGQIGYFVKRFTDYANPAKVTPKGKPANQDLVASIAAIRLAAIESFWMDVSPFPSDHQKTQWFEVWLSDFQGEAEVAELFRQLAAGVGVLVSTYSLRFPDRVVLIARASVQDLLKVENLFDFLAELRLAKIVASEFLEAPPRDQSELIEEALTRITPPALRAPSVCHLDTGVNRGHPLLSLALQEEHCLAVEPSWSTSDGHPQQHGTNMAGVALYGCLTEVLNSTSRLELRHRLESVKILPDHGKHPPELYGDVTVQAVARIEIQAPDRTQRAFALTVTCDSRDLGSPTSWSAALDQICSGACDEGRPSRLLFVAAGNTALSNRHEYPNNAHTESVEDPAQAWNAITVGAHTEKVTIKSPDYRYWQPVAESGRLSPSSRTSMIWSDHSWPNKPDIVFEGGNLAIDPVNGRADHIDDLALLTTRTSPTGALLTTTGETSAATAQAAGMAAKLWATYPHLSPESVRALMVHSARWTPAMLEEFPARERQNRLRVYGYGVPQLGIAFWSARNNATLIIEDAIQPFGRFQQESGGSSIKGKDMRLHRLPWPKEVLEQLGGLEVRMRVTLSYFIEPSPGRRGWKYKHRYRSHGLRFELKRPTETEQQLLMRLTRAAWDEDQKSYAAGPDERSWLIGPRYRNRGSIHSDLWTGTAAELAASGIIAVHPVSGWWKDRPTLNCFEKDAKYSLIISLETDETNIDLYTPIATQIVPAISTEIQTS